MHVSHESTRRKGASVGRTQVAARVALLGALGACLLLAGSSQAGKPGGGGGGSSSGELLWTHVNPEVPDVNQYDKGRVAVDLDGNVVVVGAKIIDGDPYNRDYVTVKHDAEGNELWLRTYDGPAGGLDIAAAVAVDSSGNILVTGMSSDGISGEPSDIATLKYDPDGNLLWVERYRLLANGVDSGSAIVVDAAGNVYVAGASDSYHHSGCPALLASSDFVTIKYGPDGGEPLWVRNYDGPGARIVHPSRAHYGCECVEGDPPPPAPLPELVPGEDRASALVLDSSGNVLVTGSSESVPTPGCTGTLYADESDCVGTPVEEDCRGRWDYATVKYTSDGAELWVARFEGPDHDTARGLVADAAGNVFVTGSSISSITGSDYLTVKYDAAGVEQWVRAYAGNGQDREDYAQAIAVDGAGRVSVTGSIESKSQGGCSIPNMARDIATIQYDGSGNQRWLQTYSGGGPCSLDGGHAIATDSNDNVIVAGILSGNLIPGAGAYGAIKYDAGGRRQWVQSYPNGSAQGLAIGSADHVHIAGPPRAGAGPGDGLRVLKYSP